VARGAAARDARAGPRPHGRGADLAGLRDGAALVTADGAACVVSRRRPRVGHAVACWHLVALASEMVGERLRLAELATFAALSREVNMTLPRFDELPPAADRARPVGLVRRLVANGVVPRRLTEVGRALPAPVTA